MDRIHIVVDALIHRLDAARDYDLPLKVLCLIFADQRLQLFDQILGLLLRDELGALNGIDQQLQFRKLKVSVAEMIIDVPANLLTDDIEAECLQFLKVTVKGFPFCIDLILGKLRDDFLSSQGMLIVSFF